jgi:hypothetical protein
MHIRVAFLKIVIDQDPCPGISHLIRCYSEKFEDDGAITPSYILVSARRAFQDLGVSLPDIKKMSEGERRKLFPDFLESFKQAVPKVFAEFPAGIPKSRPEEGLKSLYG